MRELLDIATSFWLGWMALTLLEGLWKRAAYAILWPMSRARRGLTTFECMTLAARRKREAHR